MITYALPQNNVAPENGCSQKERILSQPPIFRGYVGF